MYPQLVCVAMLDPDGTEGVAAVDGFENRHLLRLGQADEGFLVLRDGVAVEPGQAGEEGVALRDIAAVLSRRLNLPAVSISPEEAEAELGWLAAFASHVQDGTHFIVHLGI